MMKLGILGSTNGTDLQAIIEAEKTYARTRRFWD